MTTATGVLHHPREIPNSMHKQRSKMGTSVAENFSDFHEKWMAQLEELLKLLLLQKDQADREESQSQYDSVVQMFKAHHDEYYKIKWASAHEDILAFFGPIWLSPLESSYLWMTGWRPATAFRLVESLRDAPPAARTRLGVVTEEQSRNIDLLREKIKRDEERVEGEMERQQVALAGRKMVELAGIERRVAQGGGGPVAAAQVCLLVDAAVNGMLSGLEKVMKMADCVRLKTMRGLLEILSPVQGVDFLASTSMIQIQMRKCGERRARRDA